MGIATTALTIGTLMLGGAAAGVGVARTKEAGRQKRLREQQLEAQKKATAEVLAAPEKAAERARLTSMERRRRRARTILTEYASMRTMTLPIW